MKYRCPVCNKIVRVPLKEGSEKERFFPFCSPRCKLVDLGAWLDAEYKIMSDLKSQDSGGPTDASSDTGSGYIQ